MQYSPVKLGLSLLAITGLIFAYGAWRGKARDATGHAPPLTSVPPNEKENAPEIVEITPPGESQRFNTVVNEAVEINKNILSNPIESVKQLGSAIANYFNDDEEFVYNSPSPKTRRAVKAPTITQKIKSAMPNFTARFPTEYDSLINSAANSAGVDPAILKQLLIQESGLNPDAVNTASGAQGIAQFMPDTWKEWGGGKSPYDYTAAIPASANYLKWLLDNTGNYVDALAAYNWGIGNIWRQGFKVAPRETREYVAKITKRAGYDVK